MLTYTYLNVKECPFFLSPISGLLPRSSQHSTNFLALDAYTPSCSRIFCSFIAVLYQLLWVFNEYFISGYLCVFIHAELEHSSRMWFWLSSAPQNLQFKLSLYLFLQFILHTAILVLSIKMTDACFLVMCFLYSEHIPNFQLVL